MREIPITGTTRLGGLLGSPVSHSMSPLMHNESFRRLGIDFVYLCFDVDALKLPSVVSALRDMNTYGFNLTMPCKEAVLPCLDEISPAAEMIGAVNTVACEGGRLTGYNTDGSGYIRALRDAGCEPAGKYMVLLGAGGAAAAVGAAAALAGVRSLHFACRQGKSYQKAVSLCDRINGKTSCRADVTDLADESAMRALLSCADLLTNATSAGMAPRQDETPLADPSMLRPELFVSDVIYNPRETRLMREAKAAGCRTMNGLYMLLFQGAEAFRIWTGKEMDVEAVREKLFQDRAQ